MKRISQMLILLFVVIGLGISSGSDLFDSFDTTSTDYNMDIEEGGHYTNLDEVSTYIAEFGHLPGNYITKQEAFSLGWEPDEGNLHDVAPNMSIGGDRFYNREKKLPEEMNRKYFEADIDYDGGYRNEKRLIYSNDGVIYYTDDHYQTFTEIKAGVEK